VAARAGAQDLRDQFNVRLSLSGLYLTENEKGPNGADAQKSPFQLAYGDLRAVLDGRRIGKRLELHIDGRVRVTGSFSTDSAITGANQVTARGYLGGPEYELREAFVKLREQRFDVGLGRQYVFEADALKIDGGRVWFRFGDHWNASVFGGGYPDPYSRSLLTDYTDSAFAAGAHVGYGYDRAWGSLAAVSSYLGGNDDGGRLDPMNPAGSPAREPPRTYLAWRGFEHVAAWLDLFHDLVLDVTGAAGVQLTRLDAQARVHVAWFGLRAGYDYLSSLAIEMYLTRLLAARTMFLAGTIENNLTVQRTAHQQAYLTADVTFGKVSVYGEGRLRFRSIADPRDDPQFVDANGVQIAPSMAWEATAGARDRGSLVGLRLGVWGTYLSAFRAKSYIAGLEVGRSFLSERLGLDARAVYAHTIDGQVGATCDAESPASALATCFGNRTGDEIEAGLTVTAAIGDHWNGFVEYRMVADSASASSAIYTHVVMLRVEARY
jgi:hypothetical protein